MPSATSRYATRTELEQHRSETLQALERLNIRAEVNSSELHRLTNDVADLHESVEQRFDAVDQRVDAFKADVVARFEALTKTVQDGHAALVSALQQLLSR